MPANWNRKLGTSKKEQKIETPKMLHRRKCGCTFEYKNKEWVLKTYCYLHEVTEKIISKGGKNGRKST